MRFGRLIPALALASASALLLAGCAGGSDAGTTGASTDKPELRIGAVNEVQSWDPAQAHVGHLLQPYQPVYDSLIRREADGELVPMLATSWEYNDDNTVLTLELRDDVTFSDGTTFDADAVKANLEHFSADNGRQASQLANLDSVTVVDDDTVELNLSTPDPSLTYYLSQAAGLMGSPDAIGTDAIDAVPVGSGPYLFSEADSVEGSQYVFTANPDYWDPELQKFSRITFKVLVDATARLNALLSGQVDATILTPAVAAQADSAGFVKNTMQVDWQGLILADRDGTVTPALGDVRVRQAINYALDRETLVGVLAEGYGTATSQPFGPDSGAFVDSLEDAYPYDPAKAKELLAEAGYADGLELTLPTTTGFETATAALTQQLADVGITVKPVSIVPANFLTDITSTKYSLFFFSLFQSNAWVAVNQIISTDALYNTFDYVNDDVQTLIDGVHYAAEGDDAPAQALNEYVVEQAWFAPILRVDQLYYTSSDITAEMQVQQAVPSIYNFAPAS